MPKAPWMRDVVFGSTVRNLLSHKDFTITGVDWGAQRVKLKDQHDDVKEVRLERLYEFYEEMKK